VFSGSLVALVTPFDGMNRLDEEALSRLIEFHIAQGSDGLVIAGTTGESPTLEKSEHASLIESAVSISAGRIPIIAGTGSNSTAQTVELSSTVAALGVDAFLLVVPYYNKPVQEGLYQHFWQVADAVDRPCMLYNVPGRTVADLLPETVARLAEHPNIFGIKDATGDMQRIERHKAICPGDFRYYSGDDFTTLEFMRRGGHGVVTVSGNVAPRMMSDLISAAAAGDFDTAEALDSKLQPLNTALFVESNPIPVKWAVADMGLISPVIRLPLTPYDEQYHEQMRAAMTKAGIER